MASIFLGSNSLPSLNIINPKIIIEKNYGNTFKHCNYPKFFTLFKTKFEFSLLIVHVIIDCEVIWKHCHEFLYVFP
jgi:hypothetical protein